MNPVQCLINSILIALRRQSEAYTTVVYPTRGRAVVLRDDLGIAFERKWYECAVDEQGEVPAPMDIFDTQMDLLSVDQAAWIVSCANAWMDGGRITVNPATGLPMVDGAIGVMGNPLGMDLHDLDGFSGDFAGMDISGHDGCSLSSDSTF
ncbi:hypothetical protein [Pseudomonas tumuqii]|uniref:hypothetical protein n=1 Tax=Pseudomonas tumuqii TaxID=2715755 RepID=UPI0015529252|nr:hypothetical protein [Pseudomonas tumuqii]